MIQFSQQRSFRRDTSFAIPAAFMLNLLSGIFENDKQRHRFERWR